MNKVKKIVSTLTLLGMLILPITVHATSWKVPSTGHSFTQAWEAYEGTSSFGFIYGYNTDWINEDYSHSIYSSYHYAAVSNDNGGYTSSRTAGGRWAKIEVRHAGTAVWYGMLY